MNFSVHFDDALLERLNAAAKRSGITRNRIISLAVADWLARNDEKDWSASLKAHFRNPAPELAEETLEFQAWRDQAPSKDEPRW
jgi:predicted transcriptional regulator